MVAIIEDTIKKYVERFDEQRKFFKSIPDRAVSPRGYWDKSEIVRWKKQNYLKVSDEIISDINELFKDKSYSDLYVKEGYTKNIYCKMISILDRCASGALSSSCYNYFGYTDLHFFLKEIARRCDNINLSKIIMADYGDILCIFKPMKLNEELLEHILDHKLLIYLTEEPYKKSLVRAANEDQLRRILYFFMSGKQI